VLALTLGQVLSIELDTAAQTLETPNGFASRVFSQCNSKRISYRAFTC
jgi:hypothetical protein